jgi:hypothetical protein
MAVETAAGAGIARELDKEVYRARDKIASMAGSRW